MMNKKKLNMGYIVQDTKVLHLIINSLSTFDLINSKHLNLSNDLGRDHINVHSFFM